MAGGGDFDLDEPVRRRLEARRIAIERSFEAFVDEVRISPPPTLLTALADAPILPDALNDAPPSIEEQVLFALAEGLENSEIAEEINVSIETVKTNVKALLAKFGARNRTHLVALAYHRGILVPRQIMEEQQDAAP